MNSKLIKNIAIIASITAGIIAITLYAFLTKATAYSNIISAQALKGTEVSVAVNEFVKSSKTFTPFNAADPLPPTSQFKSIINKSFTQIQKSNKAASIIFGGGACYYIYEISLNNRLDSAADYKITTSSITNADIKFLTGTYNGGAFIPDSSILTGSINAKAASQIYLIFMIDAAPAANTLAAQDKNMRINIEII